MAGTLREFVTKWGFDVDDKPLKQAELSVQALGSSIKSVSLVAAGAAASIFGIVKSVAAQGDQAVKTSQRIGINVEALQELQYAAKLSDVENEELTMGLVKLSNAAVSASQGSKEAGKAFSQMGVKIIGANGKLRGNEELLTDIAERFSKMPDGPRKAALAMDVFGKSGVKLIPFLNEGREGIGKLRKEAQDLGVVLGADVAKQGEEFEDALTRGIAALNGIKNVVGAELLPVLTDLIDSMREFFVENRTEIVEQLREVLGSLIVFLKETFTVVKGGITVIVGISRAFGGLQNVIRIATKLMVAFLAIRALVALGSVAQALYATATAFQVFGNAALIAQAKALLIPLAIGALIAAIALIAEDIYQFATGGDSVFGILVNFFSELGSKVKDFVMKFFELPKGIQYLVTAMLGPVGMLINAFRIARDLLTWIENKFGVLEKIKSFSSKVASFFGLGGKEASASTGPTGSATTTLAAQSSPAASPIGGSTTNAPVSQQNQVSISVNVPPGTSPEKVGPYVQNGVREGLDAQLRQTSRATRPKAAY